MLSDYTKFFTIVRFSDVALSSFFSQDFEAQIFLFSSIRIEARLFNEYFYKASHSKVVKERALHVHQTKTKHFIAKLFAQPVDS